MMREGGNFKSNILREKAEVEVSAPVRYWPSTEPRQAMHMKGSCKNRPWAQRVPGVFSMALLSWRTFVSDLALEILVSLSCSNTISKSCQKPVLCFVWKAFLHYLHTSKHICCLKPSVTYPQSLPSLSHLECICHTSKAHNK